MDREFNSLRYEFNELRNIQDMILEGNKVAEVGEIMTIATFTNKYQKYTIPFPANETIDKDTGDTNGSKDFENFCDELKTNLELRNDLV